MHDISKNRILVTGGAGFIGSALIWELNQRGLDNILVTDFLGSDEKFKNLVPLRFDDYMEGDEFLKQVDKDPKRFADIKTVLHLGACSSTTEKDCRYLSQNNYQYTKTISDWALKNNARFVYASSAATYGDGEEGMCDQSEDINRLRPLNMYGYSKHLFDLYAQRKGLLNDMVGLKYFNVFGPNEYHKDDMSSVVYKAFHQINETGKVKLFKSYHADYKDGEQMRDFLYVKDAVKMTLFLTQETKAGGLYNLGSGEANTWMSLVRPIFTTLGKPENIEFIDMPEYLKPKYQYYTKADTTKLTGVGYQDKAHTLEESVSDYVGNYLSKGQYLES